MTIKRFRCFLIIGLLALFASGCSSPPKIGAVPAVVGQATYRSDQGVNIDATYYANKTVRLKFSNGEIRVLPVAISGSGARYANDCCEWWEHQGKATYAVGGQALFVGKI